MSTIADESSEVEPPEADRQRQFFRLYVQSQHRIRAYIYTLVPNWADADDMLQETSAVLWQKFDQFELGTDFVAWACQVAFWKVSNLRKKYARSKLTFDERALEMLAARALELAPELDRRREALQGCLKRLQDRDRQLLLVRYEPDGTVERAAAVSGRSLQASYKALQRLRKALFDCVTLRLTEEVAT